MVERKRDNRRQNMNEEVRGNEYEKGAAQIEHKGNELDHDKKSNSKKKGSEEHPPIEVTAYDAQEHDSYKNGLQNESVP